MRGAGRAALLVCAWGLGVGLARADDADLVAGVRVVSRALALAAATGGPDGAATRAGLPERLAGILDEVAAAPRARDLRGVGDDLELRAALLDELLVKDGLGRRLDAFAGDAGRRLARETEALSRRVYAVAQATDEALVLAREGRLASQRALRARPRGATVLAWGAEAPLLAGLLARGDDDLLRLLRRLTGHPEDPAAGATLALLARGAQLESALLDAVGGAGVVAAAAQETTGALRDAVTGARAAVANAAEVYRLVRQEELLRVVRGSREYEVQEALPRLVAYRRQFRATPDRVVALPWRGTYQDRGRNVLLFWYEDEARWSVAEDGAPLDPVVDALASSPDPRLARLASRPRVLEALHGLFAPERSFEAGLARVEAAARSAAERVEDVFAAGREAGRAAAEVDLALGAVLGVPTSLFAGGAPEEAAARARALVLDTVVAHGRAVARRQAERIQALPERLEGLRALPVRLTIEDAPAAGIDLSWRPGPDDDAWLVPPPLAIEGGVSEAGGLLLVEVGGGRPQVGVVGVARGGGEEQAWGGVVLVRPPERASLRLAPLSAGVLQARQLSGPGGPLMRVRQLAPAEPLELWLVGPHGFERPITPEPGGGLLRPSPRDPAAGAAIEARFPDGRVGARLPVPRPLFERDGVVTGTAEERQWRVEGDEPLTATVLRGAVPVPGGRWFEVGSGGQRVGDGQGSSLTWRGELRLGRHTVTADRAGWVAVGAAPTPPQVVAVRSRLDEPARKVAAGEVVLLRLDGWPVLLPDELLEVRWTIEGGGATATARTRARAGDPDAAAVLPVRIGDGASPGPRRVTAQVLTRRGRLEVTGGFAVADPGRAVGVGLIVDGELRAPAALALDGQGVVQLEAGASTASWSLVDPQGGVRDLVARSPGVATLSFTPADVPGRYRVVVSGRAGDGGAIHGDLEVAVYRAAPLRLELPQDRTVGKEVAIDATPPAGFEGPFRIRATGSAWRDGTTVPVRVGPKNAVAVEVVDARGRRARGLLEFAGDAPASAGGPRYGVVADASERAVVPVDYAALQAFLTRGTLPDDWVVLEPGPLGPVTARDRLFATALYDGPGDGSQIAYRTVRLWDALQETPRARLIALGVAPGTPFGVQDFPVPAGEATLRDLAAARVAAAGGFQLHRTSVRIRADGLIPDPDLPDDPAVVARFLRRGVSRQVGGVGRVEVPGPLADLRVVADLPEVLDLAASHRLVFGAASERHPLVAGHPYPDRWDRLAEQAFVCPELTVEVQLEGWHGEVVARRIGHESAGVEVALALLHQETVRDEARQGSPRTGERHRVELASLDRYASPSASEVVLAAIPPGALENEVRRLTVRVLAVQRRAVPARAWPAERPAPEAVTIDGAPFLFEDRSLSEASCELLVTYERVGADGPALAEPGPVEDAVAVEGAPADLGAAADLLAQAEAARAAKRLDEAERLARRALALAPRTPAPFVALAEAALRRQRPADARALAGWANALQPTGRGQLVLGEAAWTEGEVEQAEAALAEARKLGLEGEAAERAEALAGEMR